MFSKDRDTTFLKHINAIQPVYRNNGGGQFEFDRQKMTDTVDFIFNNLMPGRDYLTEFPRWVQVKSARRVAQFDEGTVRYGVHVEFCSNADINVFRIFKEEGQDCHDLYFFKASQDHADLLDCQLNVTGMYLSSVFTHATGLYLSY